MRKFIVLFMILFVAMAYSKPMRIEVCKGDNCYTYKVDDVKDFKYIYDMNGRKYMRIWLFNRNMLDIFVDGAKVNIGK